MIEKYSERWFTETIWHAELSDGTIIHQDEPEMTWLKLRDIIEQEKLSIVKLWLSFRDMTAYSNHNQDGYLFGKAAFCVWGGETLLCFMIGHLVNDEEVLVEFWEAPQGGYMGKGFVYSHSEFRKASDKEKVGDFLIRNPKNETEDRLGEEETGCKVPVGLGLTI